MCAALPAQVVSLETETAFVDIGQTQLEVGRRLLPQARTGDWVLVHAGQMISLLSPKEAAEIRELLQEVSEIEMAV